MDYHKEFIDCYYGRAKKTGEKHIIKLMNKIEKENKRRRLTDEEYNLVLKYTSRTHLDQVFDAVQLDPERDAFFDFENCCLMTLSEGFAEIADSIAYSFEEQGFSKEETEILANVIAEFTDTDASRWK